jgi:hypothetical protein
MTIYEMIQAIIAQAQTGKISHDDAERTLMALGSLKTALANK